MLLLLAVGAFQNLRRHISLSCIEQNHRSASWAPQGYDVSVLALVHEAIHHPAVNRRGRDTYLSDWRFSPDLRASRCRYCTMTDSPALPL